MASDEFGGDTSVLRKILWFRYQAVESLTITPVTLPKSSGIKRPIKTRIFLAGSIGTKTVHPERDDWDWDAVAVDFCRMTC